MIRNVSSTGGFVAGPESSQPRRAPLPSAQVPRLSLTGCAPETFRVRTVVHWGEALWDGLAPELSLPQPELVTARATSVVREGDEQRRAWSSLRTVPLLTPRRP